ncbi:MAG: hypothetical protein V4625_11575 [Pseudomonadota bacterium]
MIQRLFSFLWRAWHWIPQRRKLLRITLWLLSIPVSFNIFFFCFSEIGIYYEMLSTGAHSRSELGEDLGLGVLLGLVAVPATVISVLIFAFYSWAWLVRKIPDEKAHQPNL